MEKKHTELLNWWVRFAAENGVSRQEARAMASQVGQMLQSSSSEAELRAVYDQGVRAARDRGISQAAINEFARKVKESRAK